MQGNRKDLEWRAVEEAAGGYSGKGVPEAPATSRGRSLLADLRIPTSNRLESLSGNLAGYWSMRINQQWRLIFRWNDGKASEVKITDYH